MVLHSLWLESLISQAFLCISLKPEAIQVLLVSPAAPVVQDGVDVTSELSARQVVNQLQEVRGLDVGLGLLPELQEQGVPRVDPPVIAQQFGAIFQVRGAELRGEPRTCQLQAAALGLQVDEVPFQGGDLQGKNLVLKIPSCLVFSLDVENLFQMFKTFFNIVWFMFL